MQPNFLRSRLALFALTLLGASCSPASKKVAAASAPPPPLVTVAPVESRDIAETTVFTGRLGPVEDVEIRPRVSGHLEKVHFSSGQLVKRGDVLFTIDSRWYRATLAAQEASVAQAQLRIENAERESQRAKDLLAARAISAEEAESRSSRLAEARAGLLSAEAAREAARLDVEYASIVAPVDGRVSRALVTAGNFVSGVPSANTLLATVVSVDPMFVYVDVDENSLLSLQKLMREGALPSDANGNVVVEVGLSDEAGYSRTGVVESLGNRVDAGTGSILMRIVIPNKDGSLVAGLFARVRVPTTAKRPTVLVGQRAIGTDQSQKFVYVVGDDKKAERRTVTLGPIVDGLRIVRSGLAGGEQVIVNGTQRVGPGAPVTPELEKPQTAAR